MGRLEVRICGARNIGDTQKVGIPDPYVKILMGDNKKTQIKYKTKVVDNSLNPVWNEISKFQIADYDSAQIIFEVWNDNVMVDDLMGSYALSVNGLQRGVVQDMWAILTGTRLSSAEIHLQVLAVDFGVDPQPGSRTVSSIEEYIALNAAKPVMSATETAGKPSVESTDFDPVKKPSPVVGIPLQPPTQPYAQAPPQPQLQPQVQQPMYYAPQQPVQYVQQSQQPYPPQPQQVQYVYAQQPYAPPPPQPQPQPQVIYMQQPPPPQQQVYYQQPPPPQPGYYGPSAPQPNYYGPPRL